LSANGTELAEGSISKLGGRCSVDFEVGWILRAFEEGRRLAKYKGGGVGIDYGFFEFMPD
jgi:hypothetical protein